MDKWDTVISELVSIRKTYERLREDFVQNAKIGSEVQALVRELRQQSMKSRLLQQKEDKLLSFLIEEFDVKE